MDEMQAIQTILKRGHDVEIKRTQKGTAVFEVSKKIIFRDHEQLFVNEEGKNCDSVS